MEKETANFCEYFAPAPGSYVARDGQQTGAAQLKLDALFGEGDPDASSDGAADDPQSKLNDLFDD